MAGTVSTAEAMAPLHDTQNSVACHVPSRGTDLRDEVEKEGQHLKSSQKGSHLVSVLLQLMLGAETAAKKRLQILHCRHMSKTSANSSHDHELYTLAPKGISLLLGIVDDD